MSTVIFLDIDGVLNSMPWLDAHGFGTLDPANIRILSRIVEATNAHLVISSDWRRFHDYDVLCRRLIDEGVPDCIIGTTPLVDIDEDNTGKYLSRGLEIDAWIQTTQWSDPFLILDDIPNMAPHQERLLHTDDNTGLVERDIDRALLMLKGEC